MRAPRGVAPIGRAADSKSVGWGFESLLPCLSLRAHERETRHERRTTAADSKFSGSRESVRLADLWGSGIWGSLRARIAPDPARGGPPPRDRPRARWPRPVSPPHVRARSVRSRGLRAARVLGIERSRERRRALAWSAVLVVVLRAERILRAERQGEGAARYRAPAPSRSSIPLTAKRRRPGPRSRAPRRRSCRGAPRHRQNPRLRGRDPRR